MAVMIRYRVRVSDSFDIRQTGKVLDPQWVSTPSEMKKHGSPYANVDTPKYRCKASP